MCDLFVNLLEHFDTVSVAEADPKFVLVIQMYCFLVELEGPVVPDKPVFVLRNISLVKVVVSDRPDQVKTSI